MTAISDVVRGIMDAAATLGSSQFVDAYLLTGDAFVFGWNSGKYSDFRELMGAKLSIPADQIKLIGSAKLGFSLNGDHLLRRFKNESDLDLIIVSSDLFDESALELRARARELDLAGEDDRRRLRRSRDNIFNGYFRPDQLPLDASLMRTLFPRLAGPFDFEPARSHPVKAWLFKSWEHSRICYTDHHARIQPHLQRLRATRRASSADPS